MSQPEPQRTTIFQCAWLYYVQGEKQESIAKQLSISRPTVALYLRKARESGLVRISMDTSSFADCFLAQALTAGLDLDTAYVVPSRGTGPINDVAAAAWHVLEPMLPGTHRLGVAWGETLYAFAKALPRSHFPALEVMQLCGNMAGTPYGTLSDTSTFRIARQLGAEPHNLYAPMILSTAAIARAMLSEAIVSEHIKELRRCEIALFSPGSCAVDSHIVTSGAVSPAEMQRLRKQGARAVICGRMIDANGKPLLQFNRRVVAIELGALQQIPRRLMIASGVEKAEAVEAAIRGHLVTHLVIDESIANRLIEKFKLVLPPAQSAAAQ
jgi:DNA-binding transcriptional regulator LsrR (DeoR family)